MRRWIGLGGASVLALAAAAFGGEATAQEVDLAERLTRLEALVGAQAEQIAAQEAEIARLKQEQKIDEAWRVRADEGQAGGPYQGYVRGSVPRSRPSDAQLGSMTATGPLPSADAMTPWIVAQDPPTGGARQDAAPPALAQDRAELAAIPEGMAVLSRPGTFSLDLTGEYTRSTANRLVFRGIEIVPGIQIGVIEANEADRDTLGSSVTARYGLTDRLELDLRVPFLKRSDTITTVQQRDQAVTRTIELQGRGVGDVEVGARYQLNRGAGGGPVYVAGLRIKSDTGEGPFDIERDEFGVATRLATGSGFWGVEPSVSFLFASDPAVIFGNLSYFAHLPRDIDRVEGEITVGRVDPGDSIGAAIGFGFALNQKFSFSLGYRHNYIFPTESELNGSFERSDELQVGALLFGMSYRYDDRWSVNTNFEFGVTGDAPDMRMVVRIPLF